MAPSNLPSVLNATSQDIEMLLAAQAHLGSKNLQVHMEPYLWKTRADGVNVINIGKTWYVARAQARDGGRAACRREAPACLTPFYRLQGEDCHGRPHHRRR